jgi:hypothetical protein
MFSSQFGEERNYQTQKSPGKGNRGFDSNQIVCHRNLPFFYADPFDATIFVALITDTTVGVETTRIATFLCVIQRITVWLAVVFVARLQTTGAHPLQFASLLNALTSN